LGIANYKLLRAGRRNRRETWGAGDTERARDVRVIKVIVEGPIAGLLVVEVNSLANLVIPDRVSATIVGIIERRIRNVRSGNGRKSSDGRRRPCALRNHSTRKNAHPCLSISQCIAARNPIRLPLVHRVTQSVSKHLGPRIARDYIGWACAGFRWLSYIH